MHVMYVNVCTYMYVNMKYMLVSSTVSSFKMYYNIHVVNVHIYKCTYNTFGNRTKQYSTNIYKDCTMRSYITFKRSALSTFIHVVFEGFNRVW